jgi:outer membrane protein assembly factor BamA
MGTKAYRLALDSLSCEVFGGASLRRLSRMRAAKVQILSCFALLGMLAACPKLMHAQDELFRGPVVRSLSFSGNHAIDDFMLRISIGTSQSSSFARWGILRWLGLGEKRYFNETEFRRDSARIVLLYQRTGFRDVKVDMDANYSGDDVHLRFFIDEGEPIRITTLDVSGMADIAEEQEVLGRLPLRVGDPFNLLLVRASQDSIGAMLRNRGYPYAEIYPTYQADTAAHSATVGFLADPGPRARVVAVDVLGAQKIDEDVIRQTMSIHAGDWYSDRDLYRSQIDLYRMNLFNLVAVGLADTVDLALRDTAVTVQVNVAEAALHQIRFGPGYGTIDCFRALGAWTAYDFLGGGRTFDLSARVSKLGATNGGLQNNVCRSLQNEPVERRSPNYNVTASLTEPFFLSRNTSAAISFTAERYSELQAFLRQSIGGEVSLTWRTPIGVPLTAFYGLSQAKTDAENAIFCYFLNVCQEDDAAVYADWLLRSEVGLQLAWDRSDSPLNPTRGFRLTGDVRYASRSLGSDSLVQFTRGMVELAAYHRVARRSVFSWRVRLAAVHSPSGFLTPDDRLYGGGSNSVRGFSHNELGPIVRVIDETFPVGSVVVDTLSLDGVAGYRIRRSATGGDRLAFANAEYRFPLPVLSGRVFGALFVDAGLVYEHDTSSRAILELLDEHFRVTPGFGFRVTSPLGPMRLDIGYNPYPPQASPEWYAETVEELPGGDRSYVLHALPLLQNVAPATEFLGRFRLHFSVGQAF